MILVHVGIVTIVIQRVCQC